MADIHTFIENHTHSPGEYPVLSKQTHFIIQNGMVVSERIGINENIMHYIQETALLISIIDGSIEGERTTSDAFDT